jgi:hypothetical protein
VAFEVGLAESRLEEDVLEFDKIDVCVIIRHDLAFSHSVKEKPGPSLGRCIFILSELHSNETFSSLSQNKKRPETGRLLCSSVIPLGLPSVILSLSLESEQSNYFAALRFFVLAFALKK